MKANIFKCDALTGNGRIYPRAELVNAVKEFNEGLGIVSFEDYPPAGIDNTDRIAGRATLSIEGDYVVANIEIFESTPMGKVVSQLIKETNLQVLPTSGGKVGAGGVVRDLSINGLVFPSRSVQTQTNLQKMKNWVNDAEPMFVITDK